MGKQVKTVVVRIFLPMDMGAAARIMQAVADVFPGATLGDSGDPRIIDLVVDGPDPVASDPEPEAAG